MHMMRKNKKMTMRKKSKKGRHPGIFGLDDIICAAVGIVAGLAVFLVASSFSTVDRYVQLQTSETQYYKILTLQEEGTMFMETALGFVLQWALNHTATYGGLNTETAHREWLDNNRLEGRNEVELDVPPNVDVPICQTCDSPIEMFEYMKMIAEGVGGGEEGTGDCFNVQPNDEGWIELPDSEYYEKAASNDRLWTKPELCVILFRSCKEFFEEYNVKVKINDISHGGACGQTFNPHASHQCGEDVDLNGQMCDMTGTWGAYNHEQAVFLAKTIIKNVGEYDKIQGPAKILFCDEALSDEVNAWAAGKGYGGKVLDNRPYVSAGSKYCPCPGHKTHFHVHIDRDGTQAELSSGSKPSNSPDCCQASAS